MHNTKTNVRQPAFGPRFQTGASCTLDHGVQQTASKMLLNNGAQLPNYTAS